MVATRSGDKRHLWKEVSSAAWKPGGWATQAAALAARIQFKHWVDFERNAKKRAAQSESVASRASAALDALLQTPEPTRVSGRKRPRHARVGVGLKVIGGKVQLGLALAEIMPDCSPGPDELIQYHARSAGSLQRVRKRRKRELDIKYGLHAVSCESEVLWSDVIARCHAEAARRDSSGTARVRPRGATIANRVGVQRRHRPDRHVQLKEQQAQRQQDRVKAARAYRARIRKFARKTRAYRRAYRDGQPNSLADVERLIKVYKSHRSAEVFDKKFCHE